VKKLPMVFRTIRGNQVDEKVLRELVDIVRKSHSAE
jgi:hypothetical protein